MAGIEVAAAAAVTLHTKTEQSIHRQYKSNPQPPAIFQMATGYWLSQAIYVAAKLGVADLLKVGPKSCAELAAATSVDQRSLFRLMRALASAGVFVALSDGRFALSSVGRELRSDIPGSQRAIAITLGEIHYQAWGKLLHSVQTGSPAFDKAFGTGLFEYLQSNTEAANTFHEGMTDVASMVAYAVLMAYDFSEISSMVDVGGGEGAFLQKILELHPEIEGTVFDLEPPLRKHTIQMERCPAANVQPWRVISRIRSGRGRCLHHVRRHSRLE
jgi:hypothetical protein